VLGCLAGTVAGSIEEEHAMRSVSTRTAKRQKSVFDWVAQRLIFVGPRASPRPALRFDADEVPEIVWTFLAMLDQAEQEPALRVVVNRHLAGTGWKVTARSTH
jgi:hypothetical protein